MVRLALTGEVMLGRLAGENLLPRPPEHPWGDVLPELKRADLRLINLECVVAERGAPVQKVFTFRAPPKAIDVLQAARVDLVCLANNHVLDYGQDAFLEMLDRLDAAGITYVGAGRDEAEAWRPAFLQAQGLKIGVLAFTDNEPGWKAGPGQPGIAWMAIRPRTGPHVALMDRVRQIRRDCDLLIVTAHWGPNFRRVPPRAFQDFARSVLDAGADLWWGHSAHIFQGVERRNAKAILYDTGDFIDDYLVDRLERNDLSFLYVVEAERDRLGTIELLPTRIRPGLSKVDLATGDDAAWAMDKMSELCGPFRTPVSRTLRGLRIPPSHGDQVQGVVQAP